MLYHALAYAEKGYAVFPCQPREKTPLTPHGHNDASNDELNIISWWSRWPDANIGLALKPSDLLVVDLDRHPGKPDGIEEFKKLKGDNAYPQIPPLSNTGGNGIQLFFRRPGGRIKAKPAPGIDVKPNGYVILPPSVHPSGKPYLWAKGRSLLESDPVDCPDWLLAFIVNNDAPDPDGLQQAGPGQYPDSSGERIIERCAFMRHVAQEAACLPEPDWYHGIGVLAYTVEAPEIVHRYSAGYPGYSPDETDAKIDHWRRDGKGPPTCRTIQEKCGDAFCASCPYRKAIKSPIVLGYAPTPPESAGRLMRFPADALPAVMRDYALTAADAIQCPVDYIACGLLAVASLLIGANQRVRLGPEWEQAANLWIAFVGEPSSKKSPALEKALAIVREIEKGLAAQNARERGQYDLGMVEYDADLALWKKNRTGDPPVKPDKPVLKRLTTTDTTVEALGDLLAQNPHGVAMVCDELSAFMRAMNQYKGGRGADRSHYLAMWNNAPLTIDRKNKDPIVVHRPFLSIVGGVQPDVLAELANDGQQDGMKERFLYACPPPIIDPPHNGRKIPDEIRNALARCLRAIYNARTQETTITPLSPDAQALFLDARTEWHNAIHSPTVAETDAESQAYFVKMESNLGRLAMALHAIRRASGEETADAIQADTMRRAKTLADYFLNHGRIALRLIMQTPEDRRIETTMAWIRKTKRSVVKPRDLVTGKVAGCRKATQATITLRALGDYGYGLWQEETLSLIVS